MWIKECRAKNHCYLKIVKSVKINKQTKHEVLFNMGRKEVVEQNKVLFLEIAQTIQRYFNENDDDAIEDIAILSNYGYLLIDNILESLKLNKLVKKLDTKSRYDILNIVKLMVYDRILRPQSKLKTYEYQDRYLDIPEVELQNIYRSLNVLADNKELIENHLFMQNHSEKSVNVVFYDVTTYAFESTNEDDLRKFGYSKDKKFNEVQVVMGLAIAANGIPIGYEIFSGNTCELKTISSAMNNFREKYNCTEKIILVGDSGINCLDNIGDLTLNGDGYIVAGRIKSFSKEVTEKMFDNEGYTNFPAHRRNKEQDDDIFKCKEIKVDKSVSRLKNGVAEKAIIQQRIIFMYSSKRARKDKKDRDKLVEKAKKLAEDPNQIKSLNKRGGKKYLKELGKEKSTWEINEAAIKKDEMYDGFYAIVTSEDLSVERIYEEYHYLWKIEESFRMLKTTLKSRPMFHWNHKRILGHFVICYISLVIVRILENELSKINKSLSIYELISGLSELKIAQITVGGEVKYLKTRLSSKDSKIFDILDIKYGTKGKPKSMAIKSGDN
jgi:transposase